MAMDVCMRMGMTASGMGKPLDVRERGSHRTGGRGGHCSLPLRGRSRCKLVLMDME